MLGWLRAQQTAGIDRSTQPRGPVVEFYAPCPTEGCSNRDARWSGTVAAVGGGTTYSITCPPCVGWSVRSQNERRNAGAEVEGEAA